MSSLPPTEVQRVRGTNDFLPPDAARLRALGDRVRAHFELYGYQPIETPVLEPLELFVRKSGDEITPRIYSFTHWNRRLCLRPELTASVMRAYVNGMQDRALPLRLHYCGPTFRYEKPQRGRYRQFSQVGVECIGASGPLADSEVLRLACGALEALGLRGYRLVLGHLGAVLQLLGQLGLSAHAQTLILGSMEHLARRSASPESVAERLTVLLGGGGPSGDGVVAPAGEAAPPLPDFLARVGAEQALRVAADLLALGGLPLEGGSRSADEIVARLLEKARRSDSAGPVRAAVEFIVRLRELAGPPETALPRLEALLRERELDTAPLDDIRRALDAFAYFDSAPAKVTVDLSMGRGLWYYTGLVFEIYQDGAGGGLQLGGGGRYDELVRALGGRDSVPACGFAFGLERLDLALGEAGVAESPLAPADVLVASLDEQDVPFAIRAAETLRRAGIRVEFELRPRGARAALRRADRAAVPLVALVGERERQREEVVLRRLSTREEQRLPLGELVAAVRRAL